MTNTVTNHIKIVPRCTLVNCYKFTPVGTDIHTLVVVFVDIFLC